MNVGQSCPAPSRTFSSFSVIDGALYAGMCGWSRVFACLLPLLTLANCADAQTPPPVITLADALARARQYGAQIQSANLAAASAREDRVQAKAAALPSVNAFNQFIYTEGNGTPSGVFIANDGVHVYNEQAQVHQEFLSLFRHGEIRRAMAAEAVARARIEVASR